MIAVALGAHVVAADVSPAALARAAELGAEETAATAAEVREITGGGAHVAIDALGSAITADASIRSLRRRGRHVQVGLMLGESGRAPLPWDLVVAHELQLFGSHGMAAADYPPMLAMVADGRLQPRLLVGDVIGLEDAGAALMAMDRPVAASTGLTVVTLRN
jgi:alcohol dehydrogenase